MNYFLMEDQSSSIPMKFGRSKFRTSNSLNDLRDLGDQMLAGQCSLSKSPRRLVLELCRIVYICSRIFASFQTNPG